ncbi:MAG: methyltransferase domain-containing protein [Roseivirga sp.]|nr:methyltransferase domain-containing protein [Roseivirga sp.]
MKCSKYLILFLTASLLLNSHVSTAQSSAAGNTRFDALVSEQMNEFMVRDYWQKPEILLKLMDIQPAESIADLGAGRGYFSLKLAERVGPDGKVIALDIDVTRLNQLRLLKRYGQLEQLEIVRNETDDLQLKAASLDKIVILNSYHELSDIETILKQCRVALKPQGKVFIIDKVSDKMDNDKTSRKKLVKNHFIRRNMVEQELQSAGFSLLKGIDKYIEGDKAEATRKTNWFVVVAARE